MVLEWPSVSSRVLIEDEESLEKSIQPSGIWKYLCPVQKNVLILMTTASFSLAEPHSNNAILFTFLSWNFMHEIRLHHKSRAAALTSWLMLTR